MAVALGLAGGVVAFADGYVGGHLSLVLGVGVGHTAFERHPDRWTATVRAEDVPEGRPLGATAAGVEVVLVRAGGRIFALSDRCTYRGAALHEGWVSGDTLVCPCHGCAYRLVDGAVVRGPASIPQPCLDVREQEGVVEVRARGHAD